MPDPSHATVSASQVPSIFDRSPYATRWMMYQNFTNGMPIEAIENERMTWGKRIESVILHAAAEEIRCDIIPHPQTDYLRHPDGRVGCTPDGYAFDPQRGLGFIEAKNIDWKRWKDTWTEDTATDAVELQHQTQLMIPHPQHGMPKWGMIAALVGGNELALYPREPLAEVHSKIWDEAGLFLESVKAKKEPPVLGRAIELEVLHKAFPAVDPTKHLTESDFDKKEAAKLARLIEELETHNARASVSEAMKKEIKAQIEAMIGDAASVTVHSRFLKVTRSPIAARTQNVKAHVQMRLVPKLLDYAAPIADIEAEALESAFGLPPDLFV